MTNKSHPYNCVPNIDIVGFFTKGTIYPCQFQIERDFVTITVYSSDHPNIDELTFGIFDFMRDFKLVK